MSTEPAPRRFNPRPAIFLTLVGVAGYVAFTIFSAKPAEASATAPATPAALMAVTQEPTMQPTIDTAPTTAYLLDARATAVQESANLRDNLAQKNAELIQLSASATAVSAQATADSWNAQAKIAEQAAIKAGQDAAKADADAKLAQARNQQTIFNLDVQKIAAEQESNRIAERNGTIGAWVFGVFCVLFVGYVIYKERVRKTEYRQTGAEEIEKPTIPEATSDTSQIVSNNNRAVFEHTIRIPASDKAILREAAQDLGGIFSRRTLNGKSPAKRRYMSEGRAEVVLGILREPAPDGITQYAFMGANDMTILTDEGWQWLGITPPCSNGFIPESTQNTALPHPTPPQSTGGEVGGGESEGASA